MVRIESLAYTVAQSTDLTKWKAFAEQVLGMGTAAAPDGGLYLKMDERAYRMVIVPGDEDCYLASGWEVADRTAFDTGISALKAADVAVEPGSAALKAARGVSDLVSFIDPSGNRHELSYGALLPKAPFVSRAGVTGFKTDPYGVGHTVLPSLNFDASLKFFRDVLGFGLSDIFNFQPGPDAPVMRIYFLHAACGRHHSLAGRPLLVMHGDEDDSVPTEDARQLAEAHGSAELRLFNGAGHRLRHDPRAIAVLMGWLDRQRISE